MRAAPRQRRVAALIAFALALVAIVALIVTNNRSQHPNPGPTYTPRPQWTFFWGADAHAPFTAAELDTIARSRRVVVISAFLDRYDLAAQESAARALKARDPAIRVLFYLNTKHYFHEDLHPNYLHGFDPATMALHDSAGSPVPFHATGRHPDGTGYYVDETSPQWHAFYLATARRIMAAGRFDGIAMDSLRPLTADTDAAAVAGMAPGQINAWNAGQLQLAREVKAAFPDRIVLYNGISQRVPGQVDRDLAPLQIADAALNEDFCLVKGVPQPVQIRADVTLMGEAARRHKVLLEKVNYPTRARSRAFTRDIGGLCFGAFLLGYQPGFSYFDFSDGYGIGQLGTQPPAARLDLGAPVSAASFDGDVGRREFAHGEVLVNLGTGPASVPVAPGLRRSLAGTARIRGGTLTLRPNQAAFLLR